MKTLVVAPHADDELLGCGGTLLRRRAEGGEIGWLLVTAIQPGGPWSDARIREREHEIARVREGLGVLPSNFFALGLPTTRLDTLASGDVVARIGAVFQDFKPDEVLLPHGRDVHSDHRVVAEAVGACIKWFRYPFVMRVLAYETLSETDFVKDPGDVFTPQFFVDIAPYLERKLELLSLYASELAPFPFPRSVEAVRALAQLRGAQAGFHAAEAFCLLRERQS